jgi:hypothetical protein
LIAGEWSHHENNRLTSQARAELAGRERYASQQDENVTPIEQQSHGCCFR